MAAALCIWLLLFLPILGMTSTRGLELEFSHVVYEDSPSTVHDSESRVSVTWAGHFGAKNGTRVVWNFYGGYDHRDSESSHLDVREVYATTPLNKNLRIEVGVGQLSWGVVRSKNVVNVANQRDRLLGFNRPERLGQPYSGLTYSTDDFAFELYAMYWNRPREYPGVGRRFTIPIASREHDFSDSSEFSFSYAARIERKFRQGEFAVSLFDGADREPLINLGEANDGPISVLRYEKTTSAGIESAFAVGDWLLNLEAVRRRSAAGYSTSLVSGVERRFTPQWAGSGDFLFVAEYLYDSRNLFSTILSKDHFYLNFLYEFNDYSSTQIHLSALLPASSGATAYELHFARRIGSSWKLKLAVKKFEGLGAINETLPITLDTVTVENDHVEVSVTHFF